MKNWFIDNLTFIWQQLRDIGLIDILDIGLVSIVLFFAYKFIRERRAGKLALGVVLLFLIMMISDVLDMYVTRYFLQNIFQVGILVVIVLFQPEIRSALEKIGGEPIKSIKGIGEQKDSTETLSVIKEVSEAMGDLSEEKTGALLVFERTTKLGDIVKTGTVLNADVSSFLLKNIFFNKAPMHDGATIISGNKIHSAGCFLPLSLNEDIIKDLGTRHRAGIGMSENSDAVVVIVSEETGTISIALDGKLKRGYDTDSLAAELEGLLITDNIYRKIKDRKGTKK
ncbi:MAG: diadenylate cyclase CdaA [Clostridia bacterium]|nr:diadenylate cyclase CdaA [Clostridia bacterium]